MRVAVRFAFQNLSSFKKRVLWWKFLFLAVLRIKFRVSHVRQVLYHWPSTPALHGGLFMRHGVGQTKVQILVSGVSFSTLLRFHFLISKMGIISTWEDWGSNKIICLKLFNYGVAERRSWIKDRIPFDCKLGSCSWLTYMVWILHDPDILIVWSWDDFENNFERQEAFQSGLRVTGITMMTQKTLMSVNQSESTGTI